MGHDESGARLEPAMELSRRAGSFRWLEEVERQKAGRAVERTFRRTVNIALAKGHTIHVGP